MFYQAIIELSGDASRTIGDVAEQRPSHIDESSTIANGHDISQGSPITLVGKDMDVTTA